MKRYIFLNPDGIVKEPVNMQYLFERYGKGLKIDFMKFMDENFFVESTSLGY